VVLSKNREVRIYAFSQAGLRKRGPCGAEGITALIVLRDKSIKPLLAAAQGQRPPRGAQNPTPLDAHYAVIRTAMRGVFHELGIAASTSKISAVSSGAIARMVDER
jgi:hypothetical protein